jgi:hypothetical protein
MPPMWVGMRLLNLRYELVLGSLTCLNGFGLIYKTPSYYLEDSQFSMDRLIYIIIYIYVYICNLNHI